MGMVPVLGSSIFTLQPEDLEQGAKRLRAHFGVAPQPSPLLWRSSGISNVRGTGMEADRLPQLALSLLHPNTRRETGAVAMARALPFHPATCICGACRSSDPYQVSQATWYTRSGKSSWAAGASHWDFPWTSPSLVFNQRLKPTFSPFAPLASRSESGSWAPYQRAEGNWHVSAFANGET